jgi:hypothetical protein
MTEREQSAPDTVSGGAPEEPETPDTVQPTSPDEVDPDDGTDEHDAPVDNPSG